MSTGPQMPTPSSIPTELGPGVQDDDGLRWSPRVDLAPGVVLGERYRVIDCIGVGGMATVFRAEHIDIGKPVAIKVLGEELARKPALVERFLQEARAVSTIRHANIVEITDFGYVRDDLPFYVMEYLEGETLAARLEREGPLSWPQARRIILQLCAALAATHQQNVIHRDMKPDNVLLVERSGEPDLVKVLDFGIAKVLSDDGPKGLTRTGVIMGTAAYMSPEQAKSQSIDARTDLYAVGVMLYEMLAGKVPFEGEGVMEVLTKHIIDPVPPLRRAAPRVPAAVERVVHRALHKERDQRYPSARALAAALEALGEEGREAGTRLRLAALAVGVAAAVAAGIWAWSTSPVETTLPEPISPATAAPEPSKAQTSPAKKAKPASARRSSGSTENPASPAHPAKELPPPPKDADARLPPPERLLPSVVDDDAAMDGPAAEPPAEPEQPEGGSSP